MSLHLKKFLQQGRGIASLAPSSRKLAAAACRDILPHRPQTIVELGAGLGPITAHAAQRMHPDSRLIAIERDPDFAAYARRVAPGAEVIAGDAGDIADLLAEREITKIDLVINGLPTPSLPVAIKRKIFEWMASLPGTVLMSQLTVMPWVYLPMYRHLFDRVDFDLVLANVPPGGVYHCHGLRPEYAAWL
jgi:phospholipid N-methyltransferase